jgi:hypothetical protein
MTLIAGTIKKYSTTNKEFVMTAPTADVTFWGFVWWITHNRYQIMDAMTETEFLEAAALFAAENSDALSAADPATYTDLEWPGTITAAQDVASCDASNYPQSS